MEGRDGVAHGLSRSRAAWATQGVAQLSLVLFCVCACACVIINFDNEVRCTKYVRRV